MKNKSLLAAKSSSFFSCPCSAEEEGREAETGEGEKKIIKVEPTEEEVISWEEEEEEGRMSGIFCFFFSSRLRRVL